MTSKRLNSKQKLATVFRHPEILEALEQYDRHHWICEQCYNKLEGAPDNSLTSYYDHYWANFFHSKSAANKLVKQHNLTQFDRHPITKEPRDDADDDICYNDKEI